MVFQSYAVFPHMKVYDNIAFGLRMQKKKAAIDERVTSSAVSSTSRSSSTATRRSSRAGSANASRWPGRSRRRRTFS